MRRSITCACLTFVFCVTAQAAQDSPKTGSAAEAPILEKGKPVERQLRGGETYTYRIHTQSDQFIHVVVIQKGIDVSVTLRDSSGKQLAQTDTLNGAYGPEPISTLTESSGDFVLEVACSDRHAPPGGYEVRLVDVHAPTEADRIRITAERSYMDGMAFHAQRDAKQAVMKWESTLPLWHAIGDQYEEALSFESIGETYADAGEKSKAIDYFERALVLRKAMGDQSSQATTLENLGTVYSDLGEKQKALGYYDQALGLFRSIGDRLDEESVLTDIGKVFSDIGEKQKALAYYAQALPLQRELGDRATEAVTLNNIGKVYTDLGEQQKALDYLEQSLPIRREVGNRAGEARTLNNIGLAYSKLGNKKAALEFYLQALPLERAVGDRSFESLTLNNIGTVYSILGEQDKARDYFTQALTLARTAGNPSREALALLNIGYTYGVSGDKQKALDYYQQSLAIRRRITDRSGEAWSLNNVGGAYLDLGDTQTALQYFNQALSLQREVADRQGEALTLLNIANASLQTGDMPSVLQNLTGSLVLTHSVGDPFLEAAALSQLMRYWKQQNNPALAIFFGKEAIDRFQQIRRNIESFGQETERRFLKSKEDYYRQLVDLLIAQGRLPEAQEVLDLLKLEQYSEFTQRRGLPNDETNAVSRTSSEEKSKEAGDSIDAEITSIGREWSDLNAVSSRTPEQQARYEELSGQLTAANKKMHDYLKSLYDTFGQNEQANREAGQVQQQTSGLQDLARQLGPHTVAVYTLVASDKCVLIVITPSVRIAREVPVQRVALRGKVFALANTLANRAANEEIHARAKELYDIVVAPIEKDLEGAQASTLIWSLDDALRYVPIAALYDGRQYLVERYQNVVITTASIGNLKDQPEVSTWHGLAMGVSKDYGRLGELKEVPDELNSVVHSDVVASSHGPIPGTIMLDDLFTERSMETALEKHPPLVHIASHYVFHYGDDRDSYLLLGGKDTGGQGFRLTLADLRDDQRMDFSEVELLTLSGCQTALGSNDADGREVDGLGITAQQKGAKAVLASLWPVDDVSVGILMGSFYRRWITTPGMTKAEALRQTQLAFLFGALPDSKAPIAGAHSEPIQYSNPYYWAPFILIGNWK